MPEKNSVGDIEITVTPAQNPIVRGMLAALPVDGKWTIRERLDWINAMTAVVDMLVKVA